MPKAAKAALWFTVCNFFNAGINFITAPIFTRLLPPEEYGILTLYITYEQIIIILATWEIQMGAFQRGLFKYENNWNQYSRSTLTLINLLTTVLFLIIAVFFRPINSFTKISALSFFLLFLYLLTRPAYSCWVTRRRTLYDYKKVVGISMLFSIISVVAPIITILYFGATAAVKFNTSLIVSTLLFSGFYIFTISRPDAKLRWKEVKPQWVFMLGYEAPLVLHSLSYLVLGQADRIMIGKMVGEREAAFYGVAYTLASAVTILQNSLNQALLPWRYSKLKEKNYSIIGSTTNVLLLLIGGAILTVVLVMPEVLRLFFTQDYYEAVWCIPPVSVSVFFMFLYSSFVSVESYYEKTKYIMFVSITCGIINVILNYLLIPVFGYIVCGYTTLFSYILFALFHYTCMKVVCKKEIPGINIFSQTTILLISVGVVVCSILITILYPYWIARYSLFLIMILVAIRYRKKIKGILDSIKQKK